MSDEQQILNSRFKRKVGIMPVNHHEIIEDMEWQIRKCGGAWAEWCVGTAKDARGPFFQRHREADLGDGLAYREAYTTDAAQAVVTHMVNARGLEIDHAAAPEPGRLVFICRKLEAANVLTAAGADHGKFPKRAA
jgi:hypothetical protein